MSLDISECDFERRGIRFWIYHHFTSGDGEREDAQLEAAFGILWEFFGKGVAISPEDSMWCWEAIVSRIEKLPWPTRPSEIEEEHLLDKGTAYWINHFFTSGSQNVEDMQLDAAFDVLDRGKDGCLKTWKEIIEEMRRVENSWRYSTEDRVGWHCREC